MKGYFCDELLPFIGCGIAHKSDRTRFILKLYFAEACKFYFEMYNKMFQQYLEPAK